MDSSSYHTLADEGLGKTLLARWNHTNHDKVRGLGDFRAFRRIFFPRRGSGPAPSAARSPFPLQLSASPCPARSSRKETGSPWQSGVPADRSRPVAAPVFPGAAEIESNCVP